MTFDMMQFHFLPYNLHYIAQCWVHTFSSCLVMRLVVTSIVTSSPFGFPPQDFVRSRDWSSPGCHSRTGVKVSSQPLSLRPTLVFHFQDAWFVASYKSTQSIPWFTIHTWRRDFIKEWYRFISSAVSVLPNSNIHATCVTPDHASFQ